MMENCSSLPDGLVIMRRNFEDAFKTVVGLKKERGANGLFISVLSPTIFDKLSLFSDIYANEDLILMVMSYEIEVIVPCECQDKFKCAYCTLRSVQCFDPVWDTHVFSVSKTVLPNYFEGMKRTHIPATVFQSKRKGSKYIASRRIKPRFLGPNPVNQQTEKKLLSSSSNVHPIRSDTWRIDQVWSEDDTSQWRKWICTLKKRVLSNMKRISWTKGTEMALLQREVLELIDALYSTEHSSIKVKEKCRFECPACDNRNMTVKALTMHYRRNHRHHLEELQTKCPSNLLRYVLLETCFPKKKWKSFAMGPIFKNQIYV